MGLGSILGGFLGFESGGYTGPGGKHEPAGVVHRGEYVMASARLSALVLPTLRPCTGRAEGRLCQRRLRGATSASRGECRTR